MARKDGSSPRGLAHHGALAAAFALLAVWLPGCSLVIDVDPDCSEVSDCGAYVCNAENTACLASCVDDGECADGFVCESGGGRCISQGCVGQDEPRGVLAFASGGFEYDVARLGDHFMVLAATSETVGLLELTTDGEVVGGEGSLIVLDQDPTPPVVPFAASNDEGAALFWRGTLDTNLFDLRAFWVALDGATQGPAVIYEGRRGQNLDNPDAAYFGDDLLVVWSTFVNRLQVELLPLNADTTFGPDSRQTAPNEASVRVSDPAVASSLASVTTTAERPAIARRDTDGGTNAITVSFLDSTFQPINDHEVSVTPGLGISRVLVGGMTSAVAVAWIESNEGVPTLYRAVDNDNGTILPGTPSQDSTRDLQDAWLAAGSTEFALLWVANTLDGREGRDVFMRRFDATGQALFVTFSASGRRAVEPSRPRLVRTQDGYAAFWVEESVGSEGEEGLELMFRRFVCAR